MCILCCPFQKINAFKNLFDNEILLKYQDDEVSKAQMSKVISQTSQDNFITEMSRFQNTMKAAFHTPLIAALDSAAEEMESIYIKILQDFIRGQYYYGSKISFRREGKLMKMWRIPVRFLYTLKQYLISMSTINRHAYDIGNNDDDNKTKNSNKDHDNTFVITLNEELFLESRAVRLEISNNDDGWDDNSKPCIFN